MENIKRLLISIKIRPSKSPLARNKAFDKFKVLGGVTREVTPMMWDVMVAAAFVVVSVAVLVCFVFNSILTWLKKSHQVGPQHRPLASLLTARVRQLTQSSEADRFEGKLKSNKPAAKLAKLEHERGHKWRGMLQGQFARLRPRLNVPDENPAKEPLKLPKIRGDGGKVA